jgi:nucleoside-diphosphate-sugar epimerase
MIRVALVGAQGFVGKAIARAFRELPQYEVALVTRENYSEMREGSYDILINSAMPSARFWAKNNPADDFRETVEKTANLLYGWQFKKFVQISTVSARSQLDTVYGRHKAAAEALCGFGDNLIVRLGSMYADVLTKGVLIDILKKEKVFVHGESRYCFAPLEFVAEWIVSNLDRSGVVEVGARNSISLNEIAAHLGGGIEFEGPLDHQEIQDPQDSFPDARDVLIFLETMKKSLYNER